MSSEKRETWASVVAKGKALQKPTARGKPLPVKSAAVSPAPAPAPVVAPAAGLRTATSPAPKTNPAPRASTPQRLSPQEGRQRRHGESGSVNAAAADEGPKQLVWPRRASDEVSVAGLPDRQEMEFQAIQAIYQDEGAVQELELDLGSSSKKNVNSQLSEGQEDKAEEASACAAGVRPSTPVRRYRVHLSALDEVGVGTGGHNEMTKASKAEAAGPFAVLEVCYGRLYPLETPALWLQQVEGLSKAAQSELCSRVREEVTVRAGEECVFQVCAVISEILRQNYDPNANLSLLERMRRRDAEEAERRQAALRDARAMDERRSAEEWERQMKAELERNLLYQKKKRASDRVGEAGHGGNLDFLPEDSEHLSLSVSLSLGQNPLAPALESEDESAGEGENEGEGEGEGEGEKEPTRPPRTPPVDVPKKKTLNKTKKTREEAEQDEDEDVDGHEDKDSITLGQHVDVSRRFAEPPRPSAPAGLGPSTSNCSWPADEYEASLDDDSYSGGIVFEASIVEVPTPPPPTPPNPKPDPDAAPKPKPKPKSTATAPTTLTVKAAAKVKVGTGTAGPPALPPRVQAFNAKAKAGAVPAGVDINVNVKPLPQQDPRTVTALTQGAPAAAAGGGGRYATDFEELRFLGRGGFGSVTKVKHRVDRQVYAIKRIALSGSESGRERLMEECILLPQLYHPHIVRYYQAWIETERTEPPPAAGAAGAAWTAEGGKALGAAAGAARRHRATRPVSNVGAAGHEEGDDWLSMPGVGLPCLVPQGPTNTNTNAAVREWLYIQMEFCDGRNLRDIIDSGGVQKDEVLLWKLFRQILDALVYVHSKGLIHRDLKPANIFLSRADGGHAKLGDFGLTTEARAPPAAGNGGAELLAAKSGSRREKQQSTCVGTAFYMAPEVCQSGPNAKAKPKYDQSADMFSLGVVFFEMWHPPFETSMERSHVLGRLAQGLEETTAQPEFVTRFLPKGAPPEVAEILASLLARDPERRLAADHLLNESGLLPAGAFDPQVQRVLRALENPSSTESVALLSALFGRSEEAAKDVSFFDQLFRRNTASGEAEAEAEAEARDSLQQLVREFCRKHRAAYELCPLLRPARKCEGKAAEEGAGGEAAAPVSAAATVAATASAISVLPQGKGPPRGCQLLDAGNTLVELRTNLTEPIARAAAARAAAEEAAAEQGVGSGLAGLARVKRLYHVGTIYRRAPVSEAFAMEQSGHPREVSSAAVQFLWWPTAAAASGEDDWRRATSAATCSAALALAQEVELLHLLAEILAATGLGGPSGRVELQLTDTRLMPLLLECAGHRSLRESQQPASAGQSVHTVFAAGDRAAGGEARFDKLKGRLTEAIRAALQQQTGSNGPGPDAGGPRWGHAASPGPQERTTPGLEAVAGQLAALLAGATVGTGTGEGSSRHTQWILSELERHFCGPGAEATLSADVVAATGSPGGETSASTSASALAATRHRHRHQRSSSQGQSSHRTATADAGLSPQQQLREILSGLRSHARAVDGLLDVSLDALQPVDQDTYGPGLAFRVLSRDVGQPQQPGASQSRVVIAGGRVDRLLSHFAMLHGGTVLTRGDSQGSHSSRAVGVGGRGPPQGISAELALDKLAAALLQAAAMQTQAQQAGIGGGAWRRGGRPATSASTAAQPPWWRQLMAGWAQVLVGVAAEETAEEDWQEAVRLACALWRLGLRCEVHPPDGGPLDVRAVLEAHQQFGTEAAFAPAVPDFLVTLEQTKEDKDREKSKSTSFRYVVKTLSETWRSNKESGVRDSTAFDERQRLFDYFEKLGRRAPPRHCVHTWPPPPDQ